MKYLKLNKSILKKNGKYNYKFFINNNRKYEFFKLHLYRITLSFNDHYHLLNAEQLITKLFTKYLHNDIYIDW